MLSDARPVAFVATSDYARARGFYEGVLGLRVAKQDDYALVLEAGGAALRVVKLNGVTPSPHTVFGFETSDVPGAAAWLKARGVGFERYDFLGPAQGPDGVWTGPGGAQVAWFKDPDGNLLSISSAG